MQKENQFFSQSITEIIKKRISVRSYRPEKISEDIEEKLNNGITQIKGPFNTNARFQLVHDDKINNESGGKIGTYGVIKGAKTYLVGIVETGEGDLEELGYTFEKSLLYATSLGLGTCWLGGTFKKSSFQKTDLKANEILPVVSPIGYIADKKRLIDSAMRFVAGSNNRKEWGELFFDKSFIKPLDKKEAGVYTTALEMVRLAPSASNKQPWRVVKEDNIWHFFLQPTKGYGKALGYNIQRIDIGIAMCHFEMTLVEAGIKGSWRILKEINVQEIQEAQYTISWIEE